MSKNNVEDTVSLNWEEALEAIKAVIINAVWASDIERHFIALSDNMLDMGIAQFCQQAALLGTASLFDRDERATSLKYVLDLANDNSALFVGTTQEKIKASVAEHYKWIDDNNEQVKELKNFRDKQIAHLDKSSVKDYSNGKIPGVSDILGPSVVDKSAKLLEGVIKIVDFYNRSYNGETFDLNFLREQIKDNCMEYVRYRSAQNATTLAT